MEPISVSHQPDKKLLNAIFHIILNNGMKGTTMDKVAQMLSMSKRTLYEIFGSKEEMLKAVLSFSHRSLYEKMCRVFDESETIIEAFYTIFKIHRQLMEKANVAFFRDMDSSYAKLRPTYNDNQSDIWQNNMLEAVNKGIRQNVFRSDVNYPVLLRMFGIQMESLKRMEEFLPKDVTLAEAFDTASVSFLRSIASPKGMTILEDIRKRDNDNVSETTF